MSVNEIKPQTFNSAGRLRKEPFPDSKGPLSSLPTMKNSSRPERMKPRVSSKASKSNSMPYTVSSTNSTRRLKMSAVGLPALRHHDRGLRRAVRWKAGAGDGGCLGCAATRRFQCPPCVASGLGSILRRKERRRERNLRVCKRYGPSRANCTSKTRTAMFFVRARKTSPASRLDSLCCENG